MGHRKKEMIYGAEMAYDYMRLCPGGKIIEENCFGDVLENGLPYGEKAKALTVSYTGAVIKDSLEKRRKTMIFNPYNNKLNTEKSVSLGTNPQCQTSKCGQRVYDVKGQSICLSANGGAKTRMYKIDLPDGQYTVRKLTPVECERLQTLPDNYTEGISATQRYKCIGNGWTVDVIAHIFGFIKEW